MRETSGAMQALPAARRNLRRGAARLVAPSRSAQPRRASTCVPSFPLLGVAHPVVPEPVGAAVTAIEPGRVRARRGRQQPLPAHTHAAGHFGLSSSQISRVSIQPSPGKKSVRRSASGRAGWARAGAVGPNAVASARRWTVPAAAGCAYARGSPRNWALPLSFHAETHHSVGSLRRMGSSASKYSKKSGATSRSSAHRHRSPHGRTGARPRLGDTACGAARAVRPGAHLPR